MFKHDTTVQAVKLKAMRRVETNDEMGCPDVNTHNVLHA